MLPSNEKMNIVIVDDHPIVIQGIKNLLETDNAYSVKGQFTSGYTVLDFLKNNPVDMVLLDITLPDGSGIHFCRQICQLYPYITVLAISNLSERSIIHQMLKSGAKGYLLKTADPADILHCIKTALDGSTAFSQEIKAILDTPELETLTEIPELTKREKQILQLLAIGKKSAEIAAELYISPLTVKTHRATLLQKFATNNVVTLINQAKRYGLL